MTIPAPKRILCIAMLTFSSLVKTTVAANTPAPSATPLPSWEVLEYEQTAFFVTAKSRIEITQREEHKDTWQLKSRSSVASNSEEVELDLAAADGRALYRSRWSKGKEQRYKTYDFLPDYIERVRRDPGGKSELPPCQWPISSKWDVRYPPQAQGLVVTDAYALLLIAGRMQASGDEEIELIINTEFNFYRVQMKLSSDTQSVKTKYKLHDSGRTVQGSRTAREVTLTISPVGEQPDKYDFSLLGLNGDIAILFDEENGLPLQLRGKAPRIGSTQIELKGATLRQPAP